MSNKNCTNNNKNNNSNNDNNNNNKYCISINQSIIYSVSCKEEEIDYKDKIYNRYKHYYNKTNKNINCTTITGGSKRSLRSSKSATTNKVKS